MISHPLRPARKLRALLVDDEKLARNFLTRMLSRSERIQESVACAGAAEAHERIKEFRPDVVFLDIDMPVASGFDFLDALPSDDLPIVVFTTAHPQFAPRAFDAQACDYLLKPFDEDRLSLALERVEQALQNNTRAAQSPRRISLPLGDRVLRLSADEIDWISAEDNYVRIHKGKESLLVRSPISKLERDLRGEMFLRVHRSCMVNINRVKEVQRSLKHQYSIVLGDGTRIQCSRRYKRRLRSVLGL
jgi:two-component system LytT family response regulator